MRSRIHSPLHLMVAVLFLLVVNSAVFADVVIIKVTNNGKTSVELSDLIAYGEGQDQVKKILNVDQKSDDITLKPSGEKLYELSFVPKKFTISVTDATGEHEAVMINANVVEPKPIAMFTDVNNVTPLFLEIDQSLYNFAPPTEGTVILFTNGRNPGLPGWLLGTSIDFENGTISGEFSGEAVVVSNGLEVQEVPEPATLFLLGSGIASVALRLRRRRGSGI